MKFSWEVVLWKLTSRKFWVGLGASLASILTAFNLPDMTVNQVVVVVSGIGAAIVYLFAEMFVDRAAEQAAATSVLAVDAGEEARQALKESFQGPIDELEKKVDELFKKISGDGK